MSQMSQIPDLMRIGALPSNTEMNVDSDILEPVVFSDTFARFRLQNKGILHSNSKLTFSVDISAAAHGNGKSHFPLNVGVHSLIDRCVLKSGTKTICETSDFNHFSAYQSGFINPQHNKQRESVANGRMMCRKWEYDDGDAALSTNGAGAGASNTSAPKYSLDFGTEVDRFNKTVGLREYSLPQYNIMEKGGTTPATKTSPVYQIALNDLFPFLKMNQLPLYMMREELDIELHFAGNSSRGCVVADHGVSFKVDRDECKFIADYIYYPQEMMESYASANRKMSFTYVDYRLSKLTVDNETAPGSQTVIRNLGGAGRIVNKLFYSLSEHSIANPERVPFNKFTSQGTQVDKTNAAATARNMGVLSHNIRYNDNYLYPVDITNRARMFDNISQAHGSVPFISKDEYSGEMGLITTNLVSGRDFETNADTKFTFVEDRLNRNERINSRGIELYETWGDLPDKKFTLRCWLEVVRLCVLEDGVLTPSFA